MDLNFEIYKGKSFSGLCKDIVKNSENKKDQIDIVVSELRGLIKTVNDAVIIVPLIKDYFDVGVKNDEQLIKMSTIIQRILNSSSVDASDYGISEEEKAQLLAEIDKFKEGGE